MNVLQHMFKMSFAASYLLTWISFRHSSWRINFEFLLFNLQKQFSSVSPSRCNFYPDRTLGQLQIRVVLSLGPQRQRPCADIATWSCSLTQLRAKKSLHSYKNTRKKHDYNINDDNYTCTNIRIKKSYTYSSGYKAIIRFHQFEQWTVKVATLEGI